MRFSTIFSASAIAGAALGADHLVVVGNGSLKFEPDTITAAEGDTVTFKFWPKNHSVAQGAFAKPCEPMDNGFWSGYIPSSQGAAADTYMIEVKNKSTPIWFYCTQGQHCAGGMVGVINQAATGNKTIDAYKNASTAFAKAGVEPKSAAGTGGMIMANGTSMSNSSSSGNSNKTGAASTIQVSGLTFAGFLGVFAYNLL
ncbi:Cupredoxin [Lophiostoma macrostomum CBS 122681]|uniref:Cupredoxin n=1 Tax=Lophiostoma macrostomum CBS 122681 TaxID=1314788 RepID=A0A6A6TBU9_9PLEO|nr:Cupredoxin [Lophiostoma macrostomum CBS 122681]